MRRTLACFLLVLGMSSFGDAQAFWFTVGAGYNTYAMGDVNDDIAATNQVIPVPLDEITNGAGYGLGIGFPLSPKIDLGIGYENLAAETEAGDADGNIRFDVGANVYKATLFYRFDSASKFKTGLAGSIGMVSTSGEAELNIDGVGSSQGDITGSNALFEGLFVADYWVSPKVAIDGAIGYRLAKVSEPEMEGEPLYMPDGSREAIDYSGITFRIGLKVDFPSKKQ